MQRVAVAHEDEHGPTEFGPYMTEYGYTIGQPKLTNTDGADGDVAGGTDDTLYMYEIERIVCVYRIGNLYKLWIKWKLNYYLHSLWTRKT